MKSLRPLLMLLFAFVCALKALPQDPGADSTSTHFLIEKGIALYDEGKYDEALSIYQGVSPCDPNYWWACYETALTLYAQEKSEPALVKVREAVRLNPDDVQSLVLTASILDDTGNVPEAIGILTRAADRWPFNQRVLYNLALCYVNNHQPQLAEPILLRSIRINPYHRSSHFLLGRVNLMMGRMGQSYLAYNMAILVNPSVNYLSEYENAVTGRLDSLDRSYLYPYPAGTDHQYWDELSQLMNSGLAFDKDFDYNYDVNYLTARESILLFRKLQFNPSDTSLYSQLYVRFFTALLENKYIVPWMNYSYKNTSNPSVAEWIGKNEKTLNEFIGWASGLINSWRGYGFSVANETRKETTWQYDDDGNLVSLGRMKMEPRQVKTGIWINLGDGGFPEERGAFQNDAREGEWLLFYPGGTVKQRLIFQNGELNGTNYTYYPNGAKNGVYPRVNGKREGTEEEYAPSGLLISRISFRDDQPDGKQVLIFYDKGYRRESFNTNGKENGPLTETWLNGKPKTEVTVKDSLYDGPSRTWYANGVLESEGTFKAGYKSGAWTYYNAEGKRASTEERNDQGELSGKKTVYNADGSVQSESSYLKDELEGTETTYFENGAVKTRTEYQGGKPLRTECFDAAGKSLYQASEKGGSITLKTFYPSGVLEMEGNVQNGKYTGTWKLYDPLGRLSQQLTYKDGYMTGPQKKFHDNGKLQAEYTCDSNYIVGSYREFWPTGHVRASGHYNKDGRNGEWLTFFCNDTLESMGFFSDGIQAGRVYLYSPSGRVMSEETFNMHGKSIGIREFDQAGHVILDQQYEYDSVLLQSLYPDGKIRTRRTMVNNEVQGPSEVFFPDGKPYISNPFRYGLTDGISRRWSYPDYPELEMPHIMGTVNGTLKFYETGKLLSTDPFVNDVNQGYYFDYHPNGRVASKIPYQDDMKHGNADYFAPDSSFMFRMVYYHDVLTGMTWKNAQGEFLPVTPITPSTTVVACYYPDGKISARISFKNCLLDGPYKMYYPDGKLMKDKMMAAGYREGAYRSFYPNGNPRETSNFRNNEEEGPIELRFENGKVYMQGQYTAGQKMGEWKVWDETGQPVGILYFDNNIVYARPE